MTKLHGRALGCQDCGAMLMCRSFLGGVDGDWCMLKDWVWRAATLGTDTRFLCIGCIERRIGRKLTASDFKRSAKVNFTGNKSTRLRQRMKGLKPAKRLKE